MRAKCTDKHIYFDIIQIDGTHDIDPLPHDVTTGLSGICSGTFWSAIRGAQMPWNLEKPPQGFLEVIPRGYFEQLGSVVRFANLMAP